MTHYQRDFCLLHAHLVGQLEANLFCVFWKQSGSIAPKLEQLALERQLRH